jgi:hypothetical protein
VVHVVAGDQEGLDLEGELGRITRLRWPSSTAAAMRPSGRRIQEATAAATSSRPADFGELAFLNAAVQVIPVLAVVVVADSLFGVTLRTLESVSMPPMPWRLGSMVLPARSSDYKHSSPDLPARPSLPSTQG